MKGSYSTFTFLLGSVREDGIVVERIRLKENPKLPTEAYTLITVRSSTSFSNLYKRIISLKLEHRQSRMRGTKSCASVSHPFRRPRYGL
jgi:hypothetical protein